MTEPHEMNAGREHPAPHVIDLVDGVLCALDRPNGFRIYNLGTRRPRDWVISLRSSLSAWTGRCG